MAFDNRKPKLPKLFQSIIDNDEARRLTKSSAVVIFADAKQLHREHQDLMRAAEKATAGTKDKGTKI